MPLLGRVTLVVVVASTASTAVQAQGDSATRAVRVPGAIRGLVTDEAGRPLPGTEVLLPELGRRVRTGADGRFVVASLPSGDQRTVFRKLGFEAAQFDVLIEAGRTVELLARLHPIVSELDTVRVSTTVYNELVGTILDGSSHPLPGVDVDLVGPDPRHVRTNAQGRFVLVDIAPGAYRLRARKLGFRPITRSFAVSGRMERAFTLSLEALAQGLPDVVVRARGGYSPADSVAEREFTVRRRMAGSQSEMMTREDFAIMGSSPLNLVIRERARTVAGKDLSNALCVLIDGQLPLVDPGEPVKLGMREHGMAAFAEGVSRGAVGNGAGRGGGGGRAGFRPKPGDLNPAEVQVPGGAGFQLLEAVTADQVESIELFPAGSDFSQTACGRFPITSTDCTCGSSRPAPVVVVWLRP